MFTPESCSAIRHFFQWIQSTVAQPWLGSVINAITLPLLAWTAIATSRASKAASENNDLQLLPLLAIYFHYDGPDTHRFTIRNLGEGVAYDIKIDNWTLILQDVHEIIDCKMSIHGTNILPPGEGYEKEITFDVTVNEERLSAAKSMMIRSLQSYAVRIQIQFKDARGRRWITVIQTTDTTVNILEPSRRLGLFLSLRVWYLWHIQRICKLEIEKFLWKYEPKTFSTHLPTKWQRISNVFLAITTRKGKKRD